MRFITTGFAVTVALLLTASGSVLADQKIKTKSNIKNDRLAESSASTSGQEKSADSKAASSAAVTGADKVPEETKSEARPKP